MRIPRAADVPIAIGILRLRECFAPLAFAPLRMTVAFEAGTTTPIVASLISENLISNPALRRIRDLTVLNPFERGILKCFLEASLYLHET